MMMKTLSLVIILGIISITSIFALLQFNETNSTIEEIDLQVLKNTEYDNSNWTIFTSEKKPMTDERLKKWSENSKLTWNDFTGNPPSNPQNHAYTYTIIDYSHSIESLPMQECKFTFTKVDTQAFMVSFNSWSIKQSISLLNHEQGHFDIAKIHAQKLEQFLEQQLGKEIECVPISVSNDKTTRMEIVAKEITENIFQSLENEWYEMDTNYDEDTQVGTSLLKQEEWDKIINSKLENLVLK